ncbi:MAG: CARDB domain-containing protein [Thiohalomonadales bacterium]|nr:CARDB domain-containing protein [Thiohalomonadales bacterium]
MMEWRKIWFIVVPALFFLAGQVCVTSHAQEDTVRLMVWTWKPKCNCSADLDGALDQCLKKVADKPGIRTDLIRVDPDQYRDRLIIELAAEHPPDVILVSAEMVTYLAKRGAIMALDDAPGKVLPLIRDLPEQVLANFKFKESLYAIPLGSDEELSRSGYALTRSAAEAGRSNLALQLVAALRAMVPLRGMPDLTISDAAVSPAEVTEGEELTIMAEVKNIGDRRADKIPMHLLLDGKIVIDREVINHLAAQESKRLTIKMKAPAPGRHNLLIVVDLSGLIKESGEHNNSLNLNVAVKSFSGSILAAPKTVCQPFLIDQLAMDPNYYGSGYKDNVKAAFDGTNYLVVWRKQTPPVQPYKEHRLYGARVSPQCQVLDPNGFVITTSASQYESFNLAFDGNNYLVVWQQTLGDLLKGSVPNPYSVIAAARVSKSGEVLDTTPIIIEDSPCQGCTPNSSGTWFVGSDVAYTGTDFMVVYSSGMIGGAQYIDAAYAKFVTPQGNVKPGKTKLLTFGSKLATRRRQQLAINVSQKEGFFQIDTTDYTSQPFILQESGIWLDLKGSQPVGSVPQTILMNYWPAEIGWPGIAADGKGNYLGVFESTVGLPNYQKEVCGAIIETLSTKKISYKGSLVGDREYRPAVAFDGNNYVVVYGHVVGCQGYVGAMRVTPGGVPGVQTHYASAQDVHDVSVASGNTNSLVVFSRYNTPSPTVGPIDIFGMIIDKQ